jgi:hypothetical protein
MMIENATKTSDRPNWWTDQHATGWERIREAVRRDWEQTKHDVSQKSGHQLNQDVGDTVKQAIGKESIPGNTAPNPPRIIGDWEDIEQPISFGYAASQVYGSQHPKWDSEVEGLLKRDWEMTHAPADQNWGDAKHWIRQGYEGLQK